MRIERIRMNTGCAGTTESGTSFTWLPGRELVVGVDIRLDHAQSLVRTRQADDLTPVKPETPAATVAETPKSLSPESTLVFDTEAPPEAAAEPTPVKSKPRVVKKSAG